jgi:hypothetical protein
MAKYYFESQDSEMCYTLDYFLEKAEDEGYDKIELFEAVEDRGSGFLFCGAYDAVAEEGSCGLKCKEYKPKNGRNGACIFRGKVYSLGEKKTFDV